MKRTILFILAICMVISSFPFTIASAVVTPVEGDDFTLDGVTYSYSGETSYEDHLVFYPTTENCWGYQGEDSYFLWNKETETLVLRNILVGGVKFYRGSAGFGKTSAKTIVVEGVSSISETRSGVGNPAIDCEGALTIKGDGNLSVSLSNANPSEELESNIICCSNLSIENKFLYVASIGYSGEMIDASSINISKGAMVDLFSRSDYPASFFRSNSLNVKDSKLNCYLESEPKLQYLGGGLEGISLSEGALIDNSSLTIDMSIPGSEVCGIYTNFEGVKIKNNSSVIININGSEASNAISAACIEIDGSHLSSLGGKIKSTGYWYDYVAEGGEIRSDWLPTPEITLKNATLFSEDTTIEYLNKESPYYGNHRVTFMKGNKEATDILIIPAKENYEYKGFYGENDPLSISQDQQGSWGYQDRDSFWVFDNEKDTLTLFNFCSSGITFGGYDEYNLIVKGSCSISDVSPEYSTPAIDCNNLVISGDGELHINSTNPVSNGQKSLNVINVSNLTVDGTFIYIYSDGNDNYGIYAQNDINIINNAIINGSMNSMLSSQSSYGFIHGANINISDSSVVFWSMFSDVGSFIDGIDARDNVTIENSDVTINIDQTDKGLKRGIASGRKTNIIDSNVTITIDSGYGHISFVGTKLYIDNSSVTVNGGYTEMTPYIVNYANEGSVLESTAEIVLKDCKLLPEDAFIEYEDATLEGDIKTHFAGIKIFDGYFNESIRNFVIIPQKEEQIPTEEIPEDNAPVKGNPFTLDGVIYVYNGTVSYGNFLSIEEYTPTCWVYQDEDSYFLWNKDTKVLTLHNLEISDIGISPIKDAENGVTILLEGQNFIEIPTDEVSCAIYCGNDLIIKGDGELSIRRPCPFSESMNLAPIETNNLTIDGANVSIWASCLDSSAVSANDTKIINGATFNITINDINRPMGLWVSDLIIKDSELNCYINPEYDEIFGNIKEETSEWEDKPMGGITSAVYTWEDMTIKNSNVYMEINKAGYEYPVFYTIEGEIIISDYSEVSIKSDNKDTNAIYADKITIDSSYFMTENAYIKNSSYYMTSTPEEEDINNAPALILKDCILSDNAVVETFVEFQDPRYIVSTGIRRGEELVTDIFIQPKKEEVTVSKSENVEKVVIDGNTIDIDVASGDKVGLDISVGDKEIELYADPNLTVKLDGVVNMSEQVIKVYGKKGDEVYTVTLSKPATEYDFADLKEGEWYIPYVDTATDLGIIKGSQSGNDTLLKPEDKATRIEGVIFALRMLGIDSKSFSDYKLSFADYDEKDPAISWSADYVKAAVSLGLMKGSESGGKLYLNGNNSISRQEFFAIFARAMQIFDKDEAYKETDLSKFVDKDKIATWFTDNIKYLVHNKIVDGNPVDGGYTINPEGDILRCEIIKMVTVALTSKKDISKEEAYNIYYDTIKKFVPELMTEPQESDISIKTRDEVTFANETFVRNTNVEIKSQNVDGELQYYLLDKFPDADKLTFYYISGDEFYTASSKLNEKGNLKEWNSSYIDSFLFTHLNTPLFKREAIKSFDVKNKISETEITFIVDGSNMEYGYPQRVMQEIFPTLDDKLDDVKIILTIDNDGIPKTMSTEISMSLFTASGNLHARKTLNMDFVFNKLDNVEFDLDAVISQYALNSSAN